MKDKQDNEPLRIVQFYTFWLHSVKSLSIALIQRLCNRHNSWNNAILGTFSCFFVGFGAFWLLLKGGSYYPYKRLIYKITFV